MKVLKHLRNGTLLSAIRYKAGPKRKLSRRLGPGAELGHSPRRLNKLLDVFGSSSSYLEIGIQNGHTLEQIRAQVVVGVDPNPRFSLRRPPHNLSIYPITSDEYFDQHGKYGQFDVIFIDGLHEYGQVANDLVNASNCLKRGGAILLDDTVPTDEISAIADQAASLQKRRETGSQVRSWHGDVWKILYLLSECDDLFDWRTISGSGNPQTLVWLRPGVEVVEIPRSKIQQFQNFQYSECLRIGLPSIFGVCNETKAISDWLTSRVVSDV